LSRLFRRSGRASLSAFGLFHNFFSQPDDDEDEDGEEEEDASEDDDPPCSGALPGPSGFAVDLPLSRGGRSAHRVGTSGVLPAAPLPPERGLPPGFGVVVVMGTAGGGGAAELSELEELKEDDCGGEADFAGGVSCFLASLAVFAALRASVARDPKTAPPSAAPAVLPAPGGRTE